MTNEYEPDGIHEFRSAAILRSMLADPERSHRGEVLLSAETGEDISDSLCELVRSNPTGFFNLIRRLPSYERDVMIQYHVLRKPQAAISVAMGSSGQSRVSKVVIRAAHLLSGQSKLGLAMTHSVARVVDHPSLGEFRVNVEDAQHVLSAFGQPRDYGSE